jgi:arsenate reductase-like glutaredoxin family protein
MAKEFFNENNIQFEEKDIGSDPQALQEMLTKTKILMPPIFDIDGTIVVGYDKNKLKNLLGINK